MNADEVAIGQTVVQTHNSNIKVTFTRTGQNEGIIEYFEPISGRLVLKVKVGVFSGPQIFEYVDPTFWRITVNGQPATQFPDVSNARLLTHVETRHIEITTT